jgi:hypothetical protein
MQPSAVAIVVAENGQLPGLNNSFFADLLFPSGDIVKDELGDIGVVTNQDEDGGVMPRARVSALCFQRRNTVRIIAVEPVQSPLQFDREIRFASHLVGFTCFFGNVLANAQP